MAALARAFSCAARTAALPLRRAAPQPLRRSLCSTQQLARPTEDGKVKVVFKDTEGGSEECYAKVGEHILDVALENDIELEGACGGTLACSTCHVIVDKKYYDQLPEPEEEELDMLDLAFDLTETSRLGCQIVLNHELDGIEVTLPDEQSDARRL